MNQWRADSLCWLAVAGCLLLTGCASTPLVPPAAGVGAGATPPTSATVGDKTIIAIMAQPAPGPAHPSLPEFLGIPQGVRGAAGLFRLLRDRITARFGGVFPGLEPRPPLLTLTDPANLDPDAPPSVQAAAKVKQEQDAGAQKAKAAEFLASVGCGCYEGVAEALAENLKDCNEEVRFATVRALREIGAKSCCACGGNSCCTAEVHKELLRLAWQVDNTGCFVERSQRVRRLARLALETCCGLEAESTEETMPREGPELEEGELLSRARSGGSAAPASSDVVPKPVRTVAGMDSSNQQKLIMQATEFQTPSGERLAEVNGEPIESDLITMEAQRRWWATHTKDPSSDPAAYERILRSVLAESIDRKLLAQTARDVLSSSVQSRLTHEVMQASGDAIEQVTTDPRLRAIQIERALASELLRRQVDHDPYVSPKEIELACDRDSGNLRNLDPARVRAEILSKRRADAEAVYIAQLRDRANIRLYSHNGAE